jgi:hypothetical protein
LGSFPVGDAFEIMPAFGFEGLALLDLDRKGVFRARDRQIPDPVDLMVIGEQLED